MNIKLDFTVNGLTVPNFVMARLGESSVSIDVADLTDDQVESIITEMGTKFRDNVRERRFTRITSKPASNVKIPGVKPQAPEERW